MIKNIILSLILIFFILISNFYFYNHNLLIAVLSSSGCFLLITLFVVINSNNKKYKKDVINYKDVLEKLYTSTEELLNHFYIYFDNSFLLIHSILKDENDLKSAIDDFSILQKKFNGTKDELSNYKKQNENLLNKTDFLETEIKFFITTLHSLENKIFIELKSRIDTNIKKENFKKMVVEYEYYSEIMNEFIISIIDSINTTLMPLSEEILLIKKNISTFIKNVNGWKEDLTNDSKDKNFTKIIYKVDKQNIAFKSMSNNINNHYSNQRLSIENTIKMIDNIFENSYQIQDIAEKIQILSINASIESSRAGEFGKGFKVVANEIKKLSIDTQSFTNDIVEVIKKTKEITLKSLEDFESGCSTITRNINKQMEDFKIFYDILRSYSEDFNKIFTSISDIAQEINMHIDKFNPIFQLHDISIQELGNLNKMINKFLEDNKIEINQILDVTSKERKDEILNKLLNFIEKKVTTDMELAVISKIALQKGLKRNDAKKSAALIEFF